MFFIDATLSLRLKKVELILEGRNLLNDNTYLCQTNPDRIHRDSEHRCHPSGIGDV